MKKIVMSVLAIFALVNAFAANTQMVVENSDNTKVTFSVENVKRVTYEEGSSYTGFVPRKDSNGFVLDQWGYVDLGLSVKWAVSNLWASRPYEKGTLYAWGENWAHEGKFIKANYCSTHGEPNIENGMLVGKSDHARRALDKPWRMPTKEEFEELMYNCVEEWIENYNGSSVSGFLYTSKINGNSIFFPFYTPQDDEENPKIKHYDEFPCGMYWTSTQCYALNIAYSYTTKGLFSGVDDTKGWEYIGMMVRPVFSEKDLYGNDDCTSAAEVEKIKSEYEKRISTLTAENDQLKPENSELKTKNESLTSENTKLKSENSELKTKNESLTSENEQLKSESSELKTKNESLTDENAKLKSENERLQAEIDDASNACRYNGYAYVDLGLKSGKKWATANIGASSPSDYGEYFSWGETTNTGKDKDADFSRSNYAYSYDSAKGEYSKYNSSDKKTSLSLTDDVARVKMGGQWHMPSVADFEELIDECTWERDTEKHLYIAVGPNGNKLYFPAGSSMTGSTSVNNYVGIYGNYWTSDVLEDETTVAGSMKLQPAGHYAQVDHNVRYYGLSVRAVVDK